MKNAWKKKKLNSPELTDLLTDNTIKVNIFGRSIYSDVIKVNINKAFQ